MAHKKPPNIVTPTDHSSYLSEGAISTRKLELTKAERIHTVIGIALNSVLIPPIKEFVKKQVDSYYMELVKKYKIHTDTNTLEINKIKSIGKYEKNFQVKNVKDSNEFAKLFLESKMSQHLKSLTDPGTDPSAILNIVERCKKFEKLGDKIRYAYVYYHMFL